MERYELQEIMSGSEPGWWVSLGFTSKLERNDVLHLVASQLEGEAAGTEGRLYLERFDQMYSADGGASAVRVSLRSVEVDLTAEGQRRLSFASRTLSFDKAERIAAFTDARRIFRLMERAGYSVSVDPPVD